MSAQELAVGPVPCLAVRVTYVGELGWELYCPTEYGLRLWDTLWEAGREQRARRRRLQGDRLAAPGEGISRLGRRHLARGHAVRGRARVRGQAGQGTFVGRDALEATAGARAAPPLPRARRPPRDRARLGARPRRRRARRAGDERRLRLHGRRLDRLRLSSGRARRRNRGGGGDLRHVGRRDGRPRSRCSTREGARIRA